MNIVNLFSRYPSGELRLVKPAFDSLISGAHTVVCRPSTAIPDALHMLVMLHGAVEQLSPSTTTVAIDLSFMPYARQDRKQEGVPNDLKTFAKLLNSLDRFTYRIECPHSDVVEAVLDRVEVDNHYLSTYFSSEISRLKRQFGDSKVSVVYPDAGAYKTLSKYSSAENEAIILKTRCPNTGELKFEGPLLIKGHLYNTHCLVFDDICDGGGTFLGLADLVSTNFDTLTLNLSVAHGIFSKGKDLLLEKFDRVEALNDWTV